MACFVSCPSKFKGVIAITGATGFIGGAVARRFLLAGFRVKALVRDCSTDKCWHQSGLEWVKGELDDVSSLERLTKEADATIHCAGLVRGLNLKDFERINKEAVAHLAKVCSRHKRPPRLLLVSSLAAKNPELSHYALSKKRGEEALKRFHEGLSWTIFRPPAVYGPGDKQMRPILEWICKGVVPCLGNGQNRFSLLHVHDLAEAVFCWFSSNEVFCKTYELHDGVPLGYSWQEVAEVAERVLKKRILRLRIPFGLLFAAGYINAAVSRFRRKPPMLTPGKARELAYPAWVCDNSRICQDMNWAPRIVLADALKSRLI